MPTASLKERVEKLEAEVAELRRATIHNPASADVPWWEQRFGAFADSEAYAEAAQLGREYRESLRPQNEDAGG